MDSPCLGDWVDAASHCKHRAQYSCDALKIDLQYVFKVPFFTDHP